MTRAPIRVTSALTLRIQPGRSRSTLRPDSDSVLSMMYRATASPPQQRALTQRSEVYHALSASDAPGRELTRMATDALRSRNWFGPRTLAGLMHRAYLRTEGFSDVGFDCRPVAGIANLSSELTNATPH